METASTSAEAQPLQLHAAATTAIAPPSASTIQGPPASADASHSPLHYAAQRSSTSGRSSMHAKIATAAGGTPEMRSVTGTPQSLSQVIANLPSSAFSFDNLPDFQSPVGSGIISPIGSTRLGKKRPLSISPLSSSSVNIDALVRGSPTLIGYLAGSRSSSAGSFGHLSPSLYTITPANFQTYSRPVISLAKAVHPSASNMPIANPALLEQKLRQPSNATAVDGLGDGQRQQRTIKLEETPSQCSHRSHSQSSQEGDSESEVTTTDASAATSDYSTITESESEKGGAGGGGGVPTRSGNKPRVYYSYPISEAPHNNKCLWRDCNRQCTSLEDLVRHVNTDHIYQDSKREFICYWEGCVRDGRSFKAQYMLLVHMRRHTGEKPHKCHVSPFLHHIILIFAC